jgi:hypothetical protein
VGHLIFDVVIIQLLFTCSSLFVIGKYSDNFRGGVYGEKLFFGGEGEFPGVSFPGRILDDENFLEFI